MPAPPPRKKGRVIFWIFVAMWAIALVGVYIVVVKLKMKGEKGIREVPAAQQQTGG